jgi:hypothetical protein
MEGEQRRGRREMESERRQGIAYGGNADDGLRFV